MARAGGFLGEGGFGRRLLEAGAQRALGVDLREQEAIRGQLATSQDRLVEAFRDMRLIERLNRRLGWLALNAVAKWHAGQDEEPQRRLEVAARIREVTRVDSQMLYAIRLRNAFCFGQGVGEPKAPDPDVQDVLDDVWNARANKAELTTPGAQWRFGKDLWEVMNVYFVVFMDGLDGRVLLGSLQHDQVRGVVRDPKVWRRVLYYVVTEYVYEWDYETDAPKPNPTQRTVYYEALEGMAELREEIEQGGRVPPTPPPPEKLRPGQVLHVATNRGKEQAFGQPEMRTNLRWAASFNDILAGQVQKAKAAQQYLMKVTAGGAKTEQALTDVAMRAVGRTSPLGNADLGDGLDPVGPPQRGRESAPGSQWWETEALKAEPFDLKSGGEEASRDMESASHAFASGTNFPGHYFFGDPGSLAGSMAVELPVLKLTEIDQELVRGVLETLCDLAIERAIATRRLSERRPPTEDEMAQDIEVGPDGMVERDLSYEVTLPDPLRRNLPELMQLVVDGMTTFDPMGENDALDRALVGYYLSDILGLADAPKLVEQVMKAREQLAAEPPAPAPGPGGDPTATGPDGLQHTSANPYGARQQSQPVVEAAMAELWRRIARAIDQEREADPELRQLVEAAAATAASNGSG